MNSVCVEEKETELFADPVMVDRDGSIAQSARSSERRTLHIALGVLAAVTLALGGGNTYLATRPPKVMIIRVDGVKGAQAIRLDTGRFDIRTPEIRTALIEWAIHRYRIVKTTADDDFHLNYYLFSSELTARLRQADTAKVASVIAGVNPEQNVYNFVVSIPPLKVVKRGERNIATGRAQIEMGIRKTLELPEDQDPAKERWRLDLEYVVDPAEAAKRADAQPEYQQWNPLGISITSFYETRLPDADKAVKQ